MNHSASAPWCTHADATSGRNELMQYFKLLDSEFKPSATTASATALCHYNVSEPRVDAGVAGRNGCVRFHIHQRCPLHAPLGGASFRVESLGAHLVLCSVTDHFDGTYSVGCPWATPRTVGCVPPEADANDPFGCVQIRVELGFERYEAYVNEVRGGSYLGFMFGRGRNGFRSPSMALVSSRSVCAADGPHNRKSALLLPPPPPALLSGVESTASKGPWRATPDANVTVRSDSSSWSAFAPRRWWERHWQWPSTIAHCDAAIAHSQGHSQGRRSKSGATSKPMAFEAAGIQSVHLIGESHLGFSVDCLLGELYPNISPIAFGSQSVDGGVAMSHSASGASTVARLHNCSGRSVGCWPVGSNSAEGEAKRYFPYQHVGEGAFKRTCMNLSSTRICRHHGGNGFFRASLTLRLMIADAEALIERGEASLTKRDVIVIQVPLTLTHSLCTPCSLDHHFLISLSYLQLSTELFRLPTPTGEHVGYYRGASPATGPWSRRRLS